MGEPCGAIGGIVRSGQDTVRALSNIGAWGENNGLGPVRCRTDLPVTAVQASGFLNEAEIQA
jgi:hypothetical protein